MPDNHYIILFDGVCNLCNGSVNFVLDRDKKKKFKFGALQSDIGKELLLKYNVQHSIGYDSVVLIKNNKIYKKSSAALEVARHLNGMWPALYVFKIIPSMIRDFVYDLISRNRYRLFGKSETCRLPEPGIKERFLN
jgi:predicted DCC family thiol-disulfide oxidoreductase YuxK